MNKLKTIQNYAAKFILCSVPCRDHATPYPISLHRLPVHARICFKVPVHTYTCLYGTAPMCLSDLAKHYILTGKFNK